MDISHHLLKADNLCECAFDSHQLPSWGWSDEFCFSLLYRFAFISQLGFLRIAWFCPCLARWLLFVWCCSFLCVYFMSILSQAPDGWWLCLGMLHEESWQATGTGVLAALREAHVSPITSSQLLAVFWNHDSGLSYHCSTVVFTIIFYLSRLTSILLNFVSNPCFCALFLS